MRWLLVLQVQATKIVSGRERDGERYREKQAKFPSTEPAKHKKSMKHDNSAKKSVKRKTQAKLKKNQKQQQQQQKLSQGEP